MLTGTPKSGARKIQAVRCDSLAPGSAIANRAIGFLLLGALVAAPTLAADDAARSKCLDLRNSADQRLLSCADVTSNETVTAAEKSAAYASQGRVYLAKKDWDRAIVSFDAAIRISPHSAAYNGRGVARANKGDHQLAVTDFTEAIRLNIRNANAFNNRSIAKIKQGSFEGAVEDAEEAVRLAGLNSNYLNQLAWAYLRSHRAQVGLAYVNRALQLDPKLATAYDTRASIYEALDQPSLAIEDFKRALSLEPFLSSSADGLVRLVRNSRSQPSVADVIRIVRLRGWSVNFGALCAEFELEGHEACQFKQVSLEDDNDGKGYPRGFNVPVVNQSELPYVLIFHLNPLIGEFFVMSTEGILVRAYYRSKGRGFERIPNEAIQDEFNSDLRYWTENLAKIANGLPSPPSGPN